MKEHSRAAPTLPLAYVIDPIMLVLRSSSCLSALEGGEGRLAAKPSTWNVRKSHAGRREERAHICVFDFVCVSFGGWQLRTDMGI